MDAAHIFSSLKALAPGFAARAAQTETNRTIPAESVRDMFGAGLARILVPKSFGGYAMDFDVWLVDTVFPARIPPSPAV